MANFIDRVRKSINAFVQQENVPTDYGYVGGGSMGFGNRAPSARPRILHDRSLMSSVYTRLSMDVAAVPIRHIRRDENGSFLEIMPSYLNECLSVEANIDQGASAFIQDVAFSLFEEGATAIVPIDTSADPEVSSSYDIYSLRVGKVVAWYPKHVRVSVWNEEKGMRQDLVISKRVAAIVENPLYPVMNEPNGTLQRLMKKLSQLDQLDEQTSSGKLDIIIQLPYTLRNDLLKNRAETRRREMEEQLAGSKYGVAYAEATDKITQLNRPADNNMLEQIKRLTGQFYNQLGLTESVFDGTADEATMLNYHNRTIKPVLRAITEAMHRTWLTKTARSQGQAIGFMMDPFGLVPVSQLAEIMDKFTRNEILTSNEGRGIIGFKPVADPKADELRNKNIPEPVPTEEVKPPINLRQVPNQPAGPLEIEQ